MKKRNMIIAALTAVVILGGVYLYLNIASVRKSVGLQPGTVTSQTSAGATDGSTTVQIQPAADVIKAVSASGNIELVQPIDVAMPVAGRVNTVNVQAGDLITAGQVLLTLDTTNLQRTVTLAQIAVENQKNTIAQLKEPATEEKIATAQGNLDAAKANLAKLQSGPTQPQLAAAQSALAAAQSQYNDVVHPDTQAQLDQLKAAEEKARVALAAAKSAWDRIKWQNLPGTTSQEATFQEATFQEATAAYAAAQAAYNEAVKPAAAGNVQAAVSAIQSAKQALENLTPTAAAIASAQAQVVTAQSQLETLRSGTDPLTIKDAEIMLQQDLITLQQAMTQLEEAQVKSPISGTVLSVIPKVGQQVVAGTVVVAVADPSQLQLTVEVAEVDIAQMKTGQPAQITIDAFPGQTFSGKVSRITPVSTVTSGVVNYPVTILLTDDKLGAVRPGMTAVASMSSAGTSTADEWFVPTNAIQKQGATATVNVLRNGASTAVQVAPGQVKGDWTMVKASGLHANDQVVGSVTTKITDNAPIFGPGRRPGELGDSGRQGRPSP